MSSIAIILARGGSKRLPGKNKRMFYGKPLLAWSVEAALSSGHFDKVILSTDSQEIAEIGLEYGAEVPFLRICASDDNSSSSDATLAALGQAEEYWGMSFDVVAQLMANCPLRTSRQVSAAMNSFLGSGASSQISCFKFGWMNPWWSAKLASDRRPEWMFPSAKFSRSQTYQLCIVPVVLCGLPKPNPLGPIKVFILLIISLMRWTGCQLWILMTMKIG